MVLHRGFCLRQFLKRQAIQSATLTSVKPNAHPTGAIKQPGLKIHASRAIQGTSEATSLLKPERTINFQGISIPFLVAIQDGLQTEQLQ